MRYDTVIKGGNVVTPAGTFVGDVAIRGEQIAALGAELDTDGARVIDASGHHVIPGVLDVHVHLELPFCGTVSADDYRAFGFPGADELGNMFQVYRDFETEVVGARSAAVTRELNPSTLTFEQWLETYKNRISL